MAGGGGGVGGAGGGDVGELPDKLPPFTEAELAPKTAVDGIPGPLANVYTDLGAAPLDSSFRALMGFPIRNNTALEAAIAGMYTPGSASFRQYHTKAQWMEAFAPLPIDVHLVKLWIESHGMAVNFTAANRMLFQYTGTVAQFNAAFQTELRLFERVNPQSGNPPILVYGTLAPLTVPTWVSDRTTGIITCDLPASTDQLPQEIGDVETTPPPNIQNGRTVDQIVRAYGVDELHALGYTGQGVQLGVTVGATYKLKDLQSFWLSLGVTRANPQLIVTMEPLATRYLESTIDVQWAGAIAPSAYLIVYAGPDSRNTSMVYTFNEAIGLGNVSIITDSFAHREDSEPAAVRWQYHHAAKMAAALGITVVAASGDSAKTDTPSASPYVTAVGGTRLSLGQDGEVTDEVAWSGSGSGASLSFTIPSWQIGAVLGSNGKRAVADVALNASPQSPYWVYYLGSWHLYGGTSFASPVFAGMMAVVNSHRAANSLPQAGFLNQTLYTSPAVQATFRDVVSGGTQYFAAGPGWDYPTGWGAPGALGLATTLP